MNRKIIGLTLLSTLIIANLSFAEVPNIFADGEPAVASEVNDNFSNLDNRVTALENASSNTPTTMTIDIDCSRDSISQAVANAVPVVHLFVNISGDCNERVVISRSNVSLIGSAGASISFSETPLTSLHTSLKLAALSELQGTINIVGAKNIIIDNLIITGATNTNTTDNNAEGIAIVDGASATIQNSTITGNNIGIDVRAATATLNSNNIHSNKVYAVKVADGASMRITGNNTIDQTGTRGNFLNAAVGAFRNSTIVITGNNTISASPSSDNAAFDIYYGSQVRSYYGLLTVNGNSSVGYDSQINFRDVDHTGDISVYTKGTLRLQNRTGQTTEKVAVTGDITVNILAVFNATQGTTITGNISCHSSTSYGFSRGVVTGTVTNC